MPIEKNEGHYRVSGVLASPAGLFTKLMMRQHCNTYLVAMECCRARNPLVSVEEIGPTQAKYIAEWDE
jgi:hypothetical protein